MALFLVLFHKQEKIKCLSSKQLYLVLCATDVTTVLLRTGGVALWQIQCLREMNGSPGSTSSTENSVVLEGQ